jgi:hypothetical protein
MNVLRGTFRLSILLTAVAVGYGTWMSFQQVSESSSREHETWRVLRCSEKFLGRDMSRFTNPYGLIDVGKAGCASTQFLATFDEIRDASVQPEPSTFDSNAFWRALLADMPIAVLVFLLINAPVLLFVAVRGAGRWVLAGFRNS